jgi:hypothetical protein
LSRKKANDEKRTTVTEFDDSTPSEEVGEWRREPKIGPADKPLDITWPAVDRTWEGYTEVLSDGPKASRMVVGQVLHEGEDAVEPETCQPGEDAVEPDSDEMSVIYVFDSDPIETQESPAVQEEGGDNPAKEGKPRDPTPFYHVKWHDMDEATLRRHGGGKKRQPTVITQNSVSFP